MYHHPSKIGAGHAIHTQARCLQTVKQHMVHGKQQCGPHNGAPVEVHQQQGQRDEHAKVKLQHALRQLDMQRHQTHLHKSQHQARSQSAPCRAVGHTRNQDQGARSHQSQHRIHKPQPQDHRRDGTQCNRGQHHAVTQQGAVYRGGYRFFGSWGEG